MLLFSEQLIFIVGLVILFILINSAMLQICEHYICLTTKTQIIALISVIFVLNKMNILYERYYEL
jgi:hypothetical protein